MSVELVTFDRITEAADAIAGQVVRTPSVHSPGLTRLLGVETYAKLEILQHSGCFKPRGISNLIRLLTAEERAAGLVTVTGGNHGIALSGIAGALGIDATIVMPANAPERSKETVRANGATLVEAPDVTTAFTIAEAEQAKGRTYVHGYDDPRIIAGHGTAGLEFLTDVPQLTDVLVSIGGGALISGVATAVKALDPAVRVWGVETVGADAMSQALAAGEPVPIRVTSISTTLGAPTVTARTLAHVRSLVEEVFVISDAEAVDGMVRVAEEAKLWVEPAAGCLVPAARRVVEKVGRDAVLGLVLCGGNATVENLRKWTSA
ncbi:serine/threonine dehydratase [Virgisporangium aliadipatigenens]|uniref:Serine/threonine dehydratase n=1 Tax=Virgisporangium aliadipatigenens TaxID=741659 RepID=A0A8J3YI47_9ACTN|nr:threonine/serine dehydratase [Virgisporangium aliadipatigenens]GIJ45719.1 serine/threonine dehydratase [Virgisporangium aliadipatigenens]